MRDLFVTLFDRNYAAKGLALARSLSRHLPGMRLLVVALDREVEEKLPKLAPAGVEVVPLREIEGEALKAARANRSWREYCWTLGSSSSAWAMSHRADIDRVTYLDADLFFFSDPDPVLREIGPASIAATPHRLARANRRLHVNGRYNVGWVTFARDEEGAACLERWASQCLKDCRLAPEEGVVGDQKYLDEWPLLYPGFHEIGHPGAGLAPWNLADRKIGAGPTVDGFPVVFYHLHEFSERKGGGFTLTNYPLSKAEVDHIYVPYLSAYLDASEAFFGTRPEGEVFWTRRAP